MTEILEAMGEKTWEHWKDQRQASTPPSLIHRGDTWETRNGQNWRHFKANLNSDNIPEVLWAQCCAKQDFYQEIIRGGVLELHPEDCENYKKVGREERFPKKWEINLCQGIKTRGN